MSHPEPHILITGAGITGLLLAQALKQHGVPFSIYERDPDADFRGAGWALALHWALETFMSLIPENLRERFPESYVDPVLSAKGENGRFPFYDLASGEERYENLSDIRVRVSRERLRKILMDSLEIHWNKSLEAIEQAPGGLVTVHFEDRSIAEGTHLVGCDGTRSIVRRILCDRRGTASANVPVPVRLLGASVIYPSATGRRLQAVDPFFFQGVDPKTDSFFLHSVQDTPANNNREDTDTYRCQIIVSWPFRPGYLGNEEALEIPSTNQERLQLMKTISGGWASPFRDVVHDIPSDVQIQAIRLEDWPPVQDSWDNLGGRATLIGDAAHAMTMFRGEAANHGILDVKHWLDRHLSILKQKGGQDRLEDSGEACAAYEREMIKRTQAAVLASRQACLDAHHYASINENSPLVSKRVNMAAA